MKPRRFQRDDCKDGARWRGGDASPERGQSAQRAAGQRERECVFHCLCVSVSRGGGANKKTVCLLSQSK